MMQMAIAEHPDRQRSSGTRPSDIDRRAFDDLVAQHDGWVRGAAFSVLGRSADVDDVVQQVWLKVWERRDQLAGVSDLRKWLYTLARNAAVDAGRSSARRNGLWRRFKAMWPGGRSLSRPADEGLIAAERRRQTLRAIESLDAKYRAVLVLRVWEEMSYDQIARTLEITPQAVETRLVRARRMLRDKLMRGEGK